MDMDFFQPDDKPTQEGEQTLSCSCPKCSAKIELPLASLVEDASPHSCPACKARFVLTRETFARRATRKASEINCALCGGELDHSQYCPSCKAIYPDYFAAEFPDAAKKRAWQSRDLFGGLKNFSFEWRSSKTTTVDYKPVLMDSEPWKEPVGWQKKNIVIGVSVLVAVILIASGTSIYFHKQAKKKYATSYVMALYGIKTSTDLGLKMCGKISADWMAKGGVSLNSPPRITVDEENKLTKVKVQTEKYLQKLNDPPTAFTEANGKLLKLNELSTKLHTAALNPSGPLTSFIDLTQKTEGEFIAATADLKKALPTELSTELELARVKYRAMKDF